MQDAESEIEWVSFYCCIIVLCCSCTASQILWCCFEYQKTSNDIYMCL